MPNKIKCVFYRVIKAFMVSSMFLVYMVDLCFVLGCSKLHSAYHEPVHRVVQQFCRFLVHKWLTKSWAAQCASVSMCSLFTAAVSLCGHACMFVHVNESMFVFNPCIVSAAEGTLTSLQLSHFKDFRFALLQVSCCLLQMQTQERKTIHSYNK